MKSELLMQMDGVSAITSAGEAPKPVIVLAATNFPWNLDEALRRRLEKRVYIPLPTIEGRRELFRISLKDIELAPDVDITVLAEMTERYSGADISNICRDASMMSLRRLVEDLRKKGVRGQEMGKILADQKDKLQNPVTQADFMEACSNISSSVGERDLSKYEKWMSEYGAA